MTDQYTAPSLWVPIDSKIDLAILGKLGEEANELGNIICRSIIQGIDELNPETKRPNRESLWQEIADVQGLSDLAIKHFNLSRHDIEMRAIAKRQMKQDWVHLLRLNGYS